MRRTETLESSATWAVAALLIAGFGWGTTGLFVRTLGATGLTVYDLLLVRLVVAGVAIAPVLLFDLSGSGRKLNTGPTIRVGGSMVVYYLGAISAFTHLPMMIAALIIGSSPLIAWLIPLAIERRAPASHEKSQMTGVVLGFFGLILLLLGRNSGAQTSLVAASQTTPLYGYLGAFAAALVTVINARYLHRLGKDAPKPYEITVATVLWGVIICLVFFSDAETVVSAARLHPWLMIGFGIGATAIPGVAIAYASVRLPPQATATVSIQLQVWAGVLAWIFLKEALSGLQMIAAAMIIVGSWMCLKPAKRPV